MVVPNAVRHILVATDFSPGAAAAIDRAVQLARAQGASLDLLHVFDIGAWHSLKGVFDAQRLTVDPPPDVATRQRVTDLAATLADQTGLSVEPHFAVGDAAEGIAARARKRLCPHRRRGKGRPRLARAGRDGRQSAACTALRGADGTAGGGEALRAGADGRRSA